LSTSLLRCILRKMRIFSGLNFSKFSCNAFESSLLVPPPILMQAEMLKLEMQVLMLLMLMLMLELMFDFAFAFAFAFALEKI
jgi:hypothetical protein